MNLYRLRFSCRRHGANSNRGSRRRFERRWLARRRSRRHFADEERVPAFGGEMRWNFGHGPTSTVLHAPSPTSTRDFCICKGGRASGAVRTVEVEHALETP